jgi:beta-1,4-mannosyl-glycoprotein beta-1,4-N-acetylglucosaminyltransferase
MKIIDCFQYFDEDTLLDIRLNVLNQYVKKFVITEATYTHNGTKKKLNFNINHFKKFKDKIDYIIVDQHPKNLLTIELKDTEEKKGQKSILNGMARDYHQRENLIRGLNNCHSDDLVMISDLDEIPDLSNFDSSKIESKITVFQQKMFYYKLNLLYEGSSWFGTKACKRKDLISPQWLRNIKARKYPSWRLDLLFSKKKYSNIHIVKNGGWHFSYLKKPKELQKKLLNFAHHYEFEKSGLGIKEIEKIISEKRVIYDHNVDQKGYKWSGKSKLKKAQDNVLPNYIFSNLAKYKNWLD